MLWIAKNGRPPVRSPANRIRTNRCKSNSIGVDGPIDFALAFWSAHEVPDLRRFLVEVHDCLVDGGKLLVVEPKGHVPARTFRQMVELAEDIGLRTLEEPHVRLSRAVVFGKSRHGP